MDNSGKLLLASLTAPAVIIIWVLGASPHALAGAPSVLYAGPNWRG